MNILKGFLCGVMVLFIGLGLLLAQDGNESEAVNQELKDLDLQWVLGEVINVDLKDNLINVKCLDPEDSQEKEMSIGVDSGTTYEGVKSLDEIKPQDLLSIDYAITQDSKNLAKNIGLDKSQESQAEGQVELDKQTLGTGQ